MWCALVKASSWSARRYGVLLSHFNEEKPSLSYLGRYFLSCREPLSMCDADFRAGCIAVDFLSSSDLSLILPGLFAIHTGSMDQSRGISMLILVVSRHTYSAFHLDHNSRLIDVLPVLCMDATASFRFGALFTSAAFSILRRPHILLWRVFRFLPLSFFGIF